MRTPRLVLSVLGLAAWLALSSSPAHAVIVGTTDTSDFSNSGSDWYGMNWDYVYASGAGTAVAVGDWYLITAAHYSFGVGNTINVGGDIYEVTEVSLPDVDPGQSYRPDLKIIKVKNNSNPGTALPGYYSLYEGTLTTSSEMIVVGRGYSGTDHTTYYTEDTGTSLIKRWGTNEYDYSNRVGPISGYNYSSMSFFMDYNTRGGQGGTEFEAGLGEHDSGSGWFINDGGTWKLAGISTLRTQQAVGEFNGSYAVDLTNSDYANWITSTVPEPGTLALLGLGSVALLRRRRK